jgi:thioredoxin 1
LQKDLLIKKILNINMKMNKYLFLVFSFLILSCNSKTTKNGVEVETSVETSSENEALPTDYKGINFEKGTFAEALAKAKAEKKLVFMDAYASWCGPCKAMQKNAFPDAALGEFYNKNFVNVAYDMELGEGLALSSKYPVTGYPTLFYLDAEGKILRNEMGGRPADNLLNLGKEIVNAQ